MIHNHNQNTRVRSYTDCIFWIKLYYMRVCTKRLLYMTYIIADNNLNEFKATKVRTQ